MGRLDGMEVFELRKPVKPKTAKAEKPVKSTLTFRERERIMAKDIISTSEVARLLGKSVSEASRVVAKIRDTYSKAGTLRVDARGKLHTQDYCDHYNIERR